MNVHGALYLLSIPNRGIWFPAALVCAKQPDFDVSDVGSQNKHFPELVSSFFPISEQLLKFNAYVPVLKRAG
jgi:hypothetical protein